MQLIGIGQAADHIVLSGTDVPTSTSFERFRNGRR